MNPPKFVSASELARMAGCSVGKVTAAAESGLIQIAGRAGTAKNAPMIFLWADIQNLIETLNTGFTARASLPHHSPHTCSSAEEVKQKAEALMKARAEFRA